MRWFLVNSVTLFACCLAGCADNNSSSAEKTVVAPQAQAPTAQKTLIDDQLKALEKAKAVQDTVNQQQTDTEQAIKDAGG